MINLQLFSFDLLVFWTFNFTLSIIILMIYNYYYTHNYQCGLQRRTDKRVGASDARRQIDATILKSDDDRGR